MISFTGINISTLKNNLGLAVFIGSLAAFINLFRLHLFFEAEFVFGSFLVLLVAVFRGPLVGLVTAIIASVPLYISWDTYWSTVIFGMEALFVGYFYRQYRTNIILLVIVFWIFIGMPISWYSISQYEFFLDSHRISILIKQLTNAILYTHISALLMYVPLIQKLFATDEFKASVSIKQQSSRMISALLISIGVVFFFIGLNLNIKSNSEKFSTAHENKHQRLYSYLSFELDHQINALDEFRHGLSNNWHDADIRQASLSEFNSRHPEFRTMIMVDQQGNLINSSPEDFAINILAQNEQTNVSDRHYFINTIESPDIYVSPGFVGRGFGKNLIAAVSAGVPDPVNKQTNLGVVEGSFILSSLNSVQKLIDLDAPKVNGILVDQNNKVLLASKGIDLELLQSLKIDELEENFYEHKLVSVYNQQGEVGSEKYFYSETTFDYGWKLITLQKESNFAVVIENTLIIFAISIVLLVLIAKLLAWMLSHSWLYSMQRLNRLIERGSEFNDDVHEFDANGNLPVEVRNLYQEIKSSRLEVVKMNQELQNTVAERTEKLQNANAKLNIMARQDSLTQLDNRRVFTETLNELWSISQKNLQKLTMVILDIDHFKKVNDTYGHPAGDAVLIQLARELSKFNQPEIKSLSRLGGEEFSLLLTDISHHEAIELAEKIRTKIAQVKFPIGSDTSIEITISIGLATINTTEFTTTKLYIAADNALYEAKNSGRNVTKSVEL